MAADIAAGAVSISLIDGEPRESEGSRFTRIVLLTMAANSGSLEYPVGGIAFASTTEWYKLAGIMNELKHAVPMGMLQTSDFLKAYPFHVDIANGKVVLFGGATTAAEDVPLEEVPTTHVPSNDVYTAKLKLIGY